MKTIRNINNVFASCAIVFGLSMTMSGCAKATDNFTLDGFASPGIRDVAYLVHIYDADFQREVETKRVEVTDYKFSFTSNYDEPRKAVFQAIFDDGTICSATVPVLLVPGEKAKLKVMNGMFDLSGSDFYQQFADANDFVENISSYPASERQQKVLDYFKEHSSEEGTIMAFIYSQYLTSDKILEMMDPAIKTGRFVKLFTNNMIGMGYQYYSIQENIKSLSDAELPTVMSPDSILIKGIVTPGIRDVGYLIHIYDETFSKEETMRRVDAVNDRFNVKYGYKEPRLAIYQAIFDDGSICNAVVPIMLVPGEIGTLAIMDGRFLLYGQSGYYKAYGDALQSYQMARGNVNAMKDYLKQHSTEDGCVMAFIYYGILPVDDILAIADNSVKTGRFHRLFETGHVYRGFTNKNGMR